MEIEQIQKQPTSIDNIHQSCFRCCHILEYVLEMVKRGDSAQTIIDVSNLLKQNPIEAETAKKDKQPFIQ